MKHIPIFLVTLAATAAIGYGGASWLHRDAAPAASLLRTMGAAAAPTDPATSGLRFAAARAGGSIVSVVSGSGGGTAARSVAIGSGVVLDRQGAIVTTNAIVQQPGQLHVMLADGKLLPTHVLGTDPASGLAVIQADGAALQPIEMADLRLAAVGDAVLAVGDALGRGPAVTQGIISAIGPAQLPGQARANFIETDTLLRPGSFGGALVDSGGRLLGVIVGDIASADGSDGLAVAVPVDRVQQVVAQLRSGSVRAAAVTASLQENMR